MRGYHCTFYSNLDGILEKGIEPRNTNDHHYPFAHDNRFPRIFFMPDLESAQYWHRNHHRFLGIKGGGSVIVEFQIPDSGIHKDPYSWYTDSLMENSVYIEYGVEPNQIVDIHPVEALEDK